MISESVVVSALLKLWTLMKVAYENSVYYKIFNKIADWIGKQYRESFLYAFFRQCSKAGPGPGKDWLRHR